MNTILSTARIRRPKSSGLNPNNPWSESATQTRGGIDRSVRFSTSCPSKAFVINLSFTAKKNRQVTASHSSAVGLKINPF